MSAPEYSPEQALNLLLGKIEQRDEALAGQIRLAINAGKDVEEKGADGRGRKKERVYRKTVPFTAEEALEVAVTALQAYFVEQPLFINSTSKNFEPAALSDVRPSLRPSGQQAPATVGVGEGSEKMLEIELQTETQISGADQPLLRLRSVSQEMIEGQMANVKRLSELTTFDGD